MARDTKEQKALKIKALKEAYNELKEDSTPSKNKVTEEGVVDRANESYKGQFIREISYTSIKKPSSKEFQEIKNKIEDYKKEHKRNKSSLSTGAKKEVTYLKKTIENLMIEVAKFYDDKLKLTEQLEVKDNTIAKLREERDLYIKEIAKLKG